MRTVDPPRRRSVPPLVVLEAVAERYGVALRVLQRGDRKGSNLDEDVARTVAIMAMRAAGARYQEIASIVNRQPSALFKRIRTGKRSRFLRREVEQVLQATRPTITRDEPRAAAPTSRPVAAGDLVWATVRLVVGDPLWCALDRLAEASEVSGGAVDHRTARDALRDAE